MQYYAAPKNESVGLPFLGRMEHFVAEIFSEWEQLEKLVKLVVFMV